MSQNLKAPNGKPSNLTPEQWKLVRTPQFKAWFGDWENDTENASKVVDENGEPLVMFSGSPYKFNEFKSFEVEVDRDDREFKPRFWFTKDRELAERYSKKGFGDEVVYTCFLNVRNSKGDFNLYVDENFDGSIEKVAQKINVVIATSSNQIKLADGTNTTFYGSNSDIRFVEGGMMKDKVDELYELATEKFENNGYEVNSGSNSKTDYGHSRYFYVNQNNESQENSGLGFQVRVSDHSTGDRRILNGEQFIFDSDDVIAVFNKINYWFHPEEYKNVVAVKNKVVTIEVGEKDLLSSDEIISERVAKSGSRIFQIKRTYKNEGIVPTHIESGFKLPFKPNNPDIRFAEGGTMNTIQQGDALIYKDSEFLDFDSVIYIENVTENPNGTLVSLSNGQRMFLPQVLEKFRVATESEINRSETMGKELFSKGGVVQPRDLRKTPNFDNIYKGAEFYSYSDNQEKQTKADEWFDLFLKNQKESKLTKDEFSEFIQLSNELAWEEFEQGGNTKRTMKKIKRGGITYGNSHADGGIPVKNQSTGDMLEVEGGEGIVNKRSMASDKMVKLNGKDMTICEAVSQLNQLEGGVQFSCDDVEHQQFIEAMAKGGELERGTKTEMEHYKTLNDLYSKRITPKQASERIAKDHLKEDTRYYSKLAKMEGKMADGGMSEDLSIYADYFRSKPYEYEKVTAMSTLNMLEKNGFIEFTEETGKDRMSRGSMDKTNWGEPPHKIRPRNIKSAISPTFKFRGKEYIIGYENLRYFLNFYVLKKGEQWDKYHPQEIMADGGEIEMGKTYLVGRPEVSRGGRFNRGGASYKTIRIDENGNLRLGNQTFQISGSAKNYNFGENYVKVTQKEFDKMYSKMEGKMAKGGKVNRKEKIELQLDAYTDSVYFNSSYGTLKHGFNEVKVVVNMVINEYGYAKMKGKYSVIDIESEQIEGRSNDKKIFNTKEEAIDFIQKNHSDEVDGYSDGGKVYDDEGNVINLKVGDGVIEFRQKTPNNPPSQIGGEGKVIEINNAMAKILYEANNYEEWLPLKHLKKIKRKMAKGGTTADNPFAEFGLKKSFEGDALTKLDKLEEISANYCEVNKEYCESNVGVDRKDMPQIYEEHMDKYIDFLDSEGITYEMDFGVEVGKLKPTQENISVPRIKKILTRLLNGYYTDNEGSKINPLEIRLIATRDGYILDGHHRWASLLFLSPKNTMDVLRIDANIGDLVNISKNFDLSFVSKFAYGGKVNVKVPNYTSASDGSSTFDATIVKRGGFPQAGLYFRPTLTYNQDVVTGRRSSEYGYTNEMVTIEVGTRNFKQKATYKFKNELELSILNLTTNPKYQNFKDLFFNISTSSGSLDLIWEAKKKYEEIQLRDISGVTADKIVVIWISYGRGKGSIDVNIYTPSELNYLTQDTEFFDFIFDALNEITLDPNKNSDEGKKLAKLEGIKRKEAQKGEEEKIVKSTEYPKEVKDFNPRHLYRFKTAEELELQYNSNDWKLISNRLLNCDWLKKVTNRKILGLKVPKDSQYIMKFFFSKAYIFYMRDRLDKYYYINDFGKTFDIDLEAYKIKPNEIDYLHPNLFTIDTENYFDESDVSADVGVKILNATELQEWGLSREDFYKNAIKLAEPSEKTPVAYKEWYDSRIDLICENDSNSYIPSEIWQFFEYLNEQNMTFGLDYGSSLGLDNVSSFLYEDGQYKSVNKEGNVLQIVDKRIVNFSRFLNFYVSQRVGNRYSSIFYNTPFHILKAIITPSRVTHLSSLGLIDSEAKQNDSLYLNLNKKFYQSDLFFSLKSGNLAIKSELDNLYSINTTSIFFEKVDFNKQKVEIEFNYLSTNQLQNSLTAFNEYIDKVFCNESKEYRNTTLSITDLDLPSQIIEVLGMDFPTELSDLFEAMYFNQFKPISENADFDLRTGSYVWSSSNYPKSYNDLKEVNEGYRDKSNGTYVALGWVKWLLFAQENLNLSNIMDEKVLFSYFYDGSTPEYGKVLYMRNPYRQIENLLYQRKGQMEVRVYGSNDIYYQISTKIGKPNQSKLAKKKNQFESEISSLTQLLKIFGNDEPLKQTIIYNKIAKIRKEQEKFLQKKYFKGDLSNLLDLYAMSQQLGGQRDLANVVQCGMVTPTGEPSELDLVQYKLVRTPAFKKWFGDWEEAYVSKDYSAVSKAINPKTAEPIVCYHGKGNMKAEATYFNLVGFPVKYVGVNLSYSVYFKNIYDPINIIYEFYAKVINPIDLSMAKLGTMTPKDFREIISSLYGYEIKSRMISEGSPQKLWKILRGNPLMLKEIRDNTDYDGFIMYEDNPSDVLPSGELNSTLDYIVFENNQLKSADNRNSTFLIDSPDFRFDKGGLIKSHK